MAVSRTHSQTGAVAARTLLALFVIFGLAVFFLPTSPLGDQSAHAQTTASPSPTGPRIQFLNPSGTTANSATSGPGREVSNKSDGSGFGYHLVAWVGSMPSNPTVVFKYQSTAAGSSPTDIGTGILRGTDTYDVFWNLGTLADGTYNVIAVLFNNNVEVARDTEPVVVNNADADTVGPDGAKVPTGENTGQTVEIAYPTNAGSWGAFRKPGTTTGYIGVVDVYASTGTTGVRAYYTTTAPGSEPAWTRCSSDNGESLTDSANGVRCTLAVGVNPASVTAIAAAAGDANQSVSAQTCTPANPPTGPSPCGEGEDSGDAHRALGYVQTPTTVNITPASQNVPDRDNTTAGNQFGCSGVITGTILDQIQHKVAGANLDVHAFNPNHELYFDNPDSTSNHQPPNSNNHALEPTVNCGSAANPPAFGSGTGDQAQGQHETVGEDDIKHIETPATGTNDAGAINFRLSNRSASGGISQFTVYYDRDDDDAMCSAEPRNTGTVGWGTDGGFAAAPVNETSTCPEPTPTPTGSTSSSPSASTSPTSSASASATPSRSATPTSSPTPGTTRTVTFIASDAEVETGTQVTLSGRIFSSASSCTDNEFVQIKRRVHGEDSFTDLTSAQSSSDGSFSLQLEVTQSADYEAVAPSHDNCATATSDPATVLVKVKVSINVNEFRPVRDSFVTFTGNVTPDHDGTKVVLQRKRAGRWVKVAAATLDSRSSYRFRVQASWRRSRLFRVKWTSSDEDHESNKSQSVKVTTHR